MNSKGDKRNLKASQPGNHNAERAGVHSERRRAEKASEVRKAIAKDPEGFLAQDPWNALAETIGESELMAQDIAERGVTDRKGNLRRVVGAHARTLKMRLELTREIEAKLAASAVEARHAEPWSRDEGLRLLRDIAHNYVSAPGASIKAIGLLDEYAPGAEDNYNFEYFKNLDAMTPDELDRELAALLIPITTDQQHDPNAPPESLRTMLRRMATRPDEYLGEQEFRDLQRAIAEEIGAHPGES